MCNEEVEVIHPMSGLDTPRKHPCGAVMVRLFSTFNFTFPINNKGRVLNALNGETALPATDNDRPRLEKALAKGLHRDRPVIGKGI